jgi:two-component system chemotaxis response regulator CheB
MPGLDGYAAARAIMQACPTPIVLMSSVSDATQRVVAAIKSGALTVIRKPSGGDGPHHELERENFIRTMRLMADVLVVTRRPDRTLSAPDSGDLAAESDARTGGARLAALSASLGTAASAPQVLAIAASTGGPAALQVLLGELGPGYPLPILCTQHIARGFGAPLGAWLTGATQLPTHIAQPGEQLQAGHVYLAPDGQHLSILMRDYAASRPSGPADRYCPSADVLFETVAATYGRRAIGVILTGMGDDGARGLLALRTAGGRTLAQDEASCVVYGMPRAAVELGAVERIAPLAELAHEIRTRTKQ